MRERPILFSAPMVRALLDGTKTQTRRIVKPQPRLRDKDDCVIAYRGTTHSGPTQYMLERLAEFGCPYGTVGDRLWVRETWARDAHHGYVYRAIEDEWMTVAREQQWVSGPAWRASIHMPRCASRLTLTITDVRVQRLHDISWEDALAEGVRSWEESLSDGHCVVNDHDPRDSYARLWESINGAGAWERNDFVWALTFEVANA